MPTLEQISRQRLMDALNNSGLSQHLNKIQMALISGAKRTLLGNSFVDEDNEPDKEQKEKFLKNQDKWILNNVGPAAAQSVMELAINHCKANKIGGVDKLTSKLNGSYTHNMQLIQNDNEGCGYPSFSNVLRQFLLPRYAYLDFDNIVDPRHQIDHECGYPKFITPIMYRYMYDRDDVARRVVDIYPDESWVEEPTIYETEDEESWSPFELRLKELCDDYSLLQYLYRMDKLSGVGHYGALLIGVDDGRELDQPIDEMALLAGLRGSKAKTERNLLYLRPFDEYLSFVHQYETSVNHPRYGLPYMYNLVFLDMTIDAAGASIGTRLNRRVHWSRVVHCADNLQSSLVFGVPRMQSCFNRLLDLRKMKGAAGEMFWKGGFPGISFEIDPKFVADDPEYDEEKMRRQIEDFSNGLTRYLTNIGISAKTLSPNIIENPDRYVKIQLEAIAMMLGVPMRVFAGSEEGKLASSQDKLTWNQRVKRKLNNFTNPNIIRNTIDRFIAIGVMPPPTTGKYFIEWPDLNTPTDEDKANLSLKWTQALSQYVSSGVIHLIQPKDYLTIIMGLTPAQALRIIAEVENKGGWQKLLKVDPSDQGGQNNKKTATAGSGSGDSQGTGSSS